MLTLSRSVVLALSTVAILTQACTLASPTTIDMKEKPGDDTASATDGTDPKASGGSSGGAASATPASACGQKIVKVDLSKLKACGTAPLTGHCYAKALMPGSEEGNFAACENKDDICVSDKLLTSGGDKAASCKSFGGKPGACASLLSGALKAAVDSKQIPVDTCAADEGCAPCINPLTQADSGACGAIGVLDRTCDGAAAPAGGAASTATKPAALPSCCGSAGVCGSAEIPGASSAPQLTCAAGNVCIPKAFVELKPVACDAGVLRGGKGVCMDKCFSSMLDSVSKFGALKQETCGATELCISCTMMKLQSDQKIPGCPTDE